MRFKQFTAVVAVGSACLLAGAPVRADDAKKPAPAAATTQPSEAGHWRMRGEGRPLRGEGDGSGHDHEGGPGGFRPSAEQIDEFLAVLREIKPENVSRFENLRKENPEKFGDIIRQSMPKLMELTYLKRHDQEMFKLRVEDFKLDEATANLARQIHTQVAGSNNEATIKDLRAQLQAKVEEQFNVRQKIRDRALASLEKQIADMKTKIEANKAAKDQIIKDRIDDLTGTSTKPEW